MFGTSYCGGCHHTSSTFLFVNSVSVHLVGDEDSGGGGTAPNGAVGTKRTYSL